MEIRKLHNKLVAAVNFY